MRVLGRFVVTVVAMGVLAFGVGGVALAQDASPDVTRTEMVPPKENGAWSRAFHPGFEVFLPTRGVFHDRLLFTLPGNGYPLDFALSWLSGIDHDGPFGLNWRSSLSGHLEERENGDVVILDERGEELLFTTAPGGYQTPQGCYARLVKLTKGKREKPAGWELTYSDCWVRVYDKKGRWSGLRRPDGQLIKLKRSKNHTLRKIISPERRNVSFRYDKRGRLRQVLDWGKKKQRRRFEFTYDASFRLTQITVPVDVGRAGTHGYTYDAADRLVTVANRGNDVIGTAVYGTDGRCEEIQGDGGTVTFAPGAGLVSTRDASGFDFETSFDAAGRVTEHRALGGSDPDRVFAYQYDALGRILRETQPEGDAIERAFAADGPSVDPRDLGNALTVTHVSATPQDPDRVTTWTYLAGTSLPTSQVLPGGARWDWTYDAAKRLTAISAPATERETGPERGLTRFEYDKFGRRVRTIQADGAIDEVKYRGGKRARDEILAETLDVGTGNDPVTGRPYVNQQTKYTYDSRGNLVRTQFADKARTEVVYDFLGMPTSYTNELGVTTTFTYDLDGNLRSVSTPLVDSFGNPVESGVAETMNSYDGLGRITRTQRPDGFGETSDVRQEFDAGSRRPSLITRTKGDIEQRTYDAFGQLTQTVRAAGTADELVRNFTRDRAGRYLTDTDGLGGGKTHVYDGFGRRVRTTDAEGGATLYTYDDAGLIDSVTSLDDQAQVVAQRRLEYDALGRQVTRVDDRFTDPGSIESNETSTRRHTARGFLELETDVNGATTRYVYDGVGQLVRKIESQLDLITEYDHDLRGNIVCRRELRGPGAGAVVRETLMEYDAAGNLVAFTDPGGNTVRYGYDTLGSIDRTTGPDTFISVHVHDANGRLRSELEGSPTTNGRTSSYDYDAAGNLTEVTGPDGRVIRYTYNLLGRVKTESANGTQVMEYEYDAAGAVIQTIEVGGRTVDYAYDGRGLLTQRSAASGEVQVFTYDALGRIVEATDQVPGPGAIQLVQMTYDSTGNVLEQTQPGGVIEKLWHDGSKPRRLLTAMGDAYVTQLDAAGRVSRLEKLGDAGNVWIYGYEQGTRRVERRDHTRLSSVYEVDELDRRVSVMHNGPSSSDSWTGSWNGAGQLAEQTSADGTREANSFDDIGRFTQQVREEGNVEYDRTTIGWDANLDRPASIQTTFDDPGKFSLLAYDPLGLLATVDGASLNRDAHMSATNAYENRPAYTEGEVTYTLDAFGRVVEVRDASDQSLIANFAYDAFNRPVLATELQFTGSGLLTRYRLFDGCRLVDELSPTPMTSGDGFDLFYLPDYAGSGHLMTGFQDSFSSEDLHLDDLHGHVRMLRGLNGSVQERYDRANAWGTPHFRFFDQQLNPIDFRGAPSLQTVANAPGQASSYASGLAFSWAGLVRDPFLPRPLPYPHVTGNPLPLPHGPQPRPQPETPPPVVNPLPGPDVARAACDDALATICDKVSRLERAGSLATKCNQAMYNAQVHRDQQRRVLDQALKDQRKVLEQIRSHESNLAKLKLLDSALGLVKGKASSMKRLGQGLKRSKNLANAAKKAKMRSRVTGGILDSRASKVAYDAVEEFVGEQVADALKDATTGKVLDEVEGAIKEALGLPADFSIPGGIGLTFGQFLSGDTFEGRAAHLKANLFVAEANEKLSRSRIDRAERRIRRLWDYKRYLDAGAKNACRAFESAAAKAASWPSPELDKKLADGKEAKAILDEELSYTVR